jgi:hypothetical protein
MATITWTGIFGGNWSDPTGWSSGGVPRAGDTVSLSQILNGPYTVHLDASEGAYAALTISAANATLALYTGGLTLSVTGATTLSAGDVAIAGDAALDTGTFRETGGFLGMSDGVLGVTGQATLAGGGLAVWGGALQAAALDFAGGSFGISGGEVDVTNQVSVDGGTAGFYGGALSAGSLAMSSGSLGMSGGSITISGALTLSGGTLALYNPAATLAAGSLTQTGGSLGMSGGTLSVGGLADFIGGTNAFYGGSIFNAGSLQVGSSGAPETLTVNGGALTVSGVASIAAGSTVSMYGGSLTAAGGIVDSGTIIGQGTLGGPISGSGVIYAQSGTLDITGNVAAGPVFQINSGGDLKIDGTAVAAQSLLLDAPNQILEIGPHGSLTIDQSQGGAVSTIEMEGGTLTDPQGFRASFAIAGFGTINGTQYSVGYHGSPITASGGELTINGDIYVSNTAQIAAGATFDMEGSTLRSPIQGDPHIAGPLSFTFLSDSGTLLLGNATARQSFEANGVIAGMNISTTGLPSTVLDLADVSSGSITSASVANGNTIQLFNGSTLIDQFNLASSVGPAVVHWAADSSGAGTNIFLGTT